jgi:putative oxidoreductase
VDRTWLVLFTFVNTDPGIVRRAYSLLVNFGRFSQTPLLLLIRFYFFWQLFKIGIGKLGNIGLVIDYFSQLGIPFPALNAYVVGATECFGGLFILLGLASRLASVPVIIALVVAYWVGDNNAVLNIWGHPDKFEKAAPFPFLFAALIIFCFGPGLASVDALLGRFWERRKKAQA